MNVKPFTGKARRRRHSSLSKNEEPRSDPHVVLSISPKVETSLGREMFDMLSSAASAMQVPSEVFVARKGYGNCIKKVVAVAGH